jgi:hypothetical protein
MEKDCYAYQGPLAEVVHYGLYFHAVKDGILIKTYKTLEEAMAFLSVERAAKATRANEALPLSLDMSRFVHRIGVKCFLLFR